MKHSLAIVASGLVLCLGHNASAQTYTSSGNSVAIPDNNATGATLDIVVNDWGAITDLNIGLLITHTWQGDIVATLQHMDTGTTATLINRPGVPLSSFGYAADNYGNINTPANFVLDDSAAAVYDRPPLGGGPNDTNGIANVTGSWKPDGLPNDGIAGTGSLAVFIGQNIHGTWRLHVQDLEPGDIGAIRTLELSFASQSGCGDPGTGSCYQTHGVACNDAECCATICTIDPFCCTVTWDGICVGEANELCASCGNPNAESCFVPHASPNCNNEDCCTAICSFDPYCCDVEWDNYCVAWASAICVATPPANDTCPASALLDNQSIPYTTIGATTDSPQHPACATNGIGADVWYSYNATFSGVMTIRVCSNYPASIVVYGNCVCPTLGAPIACSGESLGTCGEYPYNFETSFETFSGQCFKIRIGGQAFGEPLYFAGEGQISVFKDFCVGDVDDDNDVDIDDLLEVIGTWGAVAAPGTLPGDIATPGGDGVINIDDLLEIIGGWGVCPNQCASGFVCFNEPSPCRLGTSNDCICFTSIDGNTVCSEGGPCDGFECGPGGTCPPGYVCAVNTCCGVPTCVPLCGTGQGGFGAQQPLPPGTRTTMGVVGADGKIQSSTANGER